MRSFTTWRESVRGLEFLLRWWNPLQIFGLVGLKIFGTQLWWNPPKNKLYHWKCMAVWRSCKGWPMRPTRMFCPQILYYEKGNSSWSSTSNFVILEQNVGACVILHFHHKIRPYFKLNCLLIILVKRRMN